MLTVLLTSPLSILSSLFLPSPSLLSLLPSCSPLFPHLGREEDLCTLVASPFLGTTSLPSHSPPPSQPLLGLL